MKCHLQVQQGNMAKAVRPDFKINAKVGDNINFEIVFSLFKSPTKANTLSAKVDIVDLAILMKD